MKFKIVGTGSNANYDYRKYKRLAPPKREKSIPDKDLIINKGASNTQANKSQDEYFYKGKPFQSDKPHV
jgi:hypothetical protein